MWCISHSIGVQVLHGSFLTREYLYLHFMTIYISIDTCLLRFCTFGLQLHLFDSYRQFFELDADVLFAFHEETWCIMVAGNAFRKPFSCALFWHDYWSSCFVMFMRKIWRVVHDDLLGLLVSMFCHILMSSVKLVNKFLANGKIPFLEILLSFQKYRLAVL